MNRLLPLIAITALLCSVTVQQLRAQGNTSFNKNAVPINGTNSTGIGRGALINNTGAYNTATGDSALHLNTTGYWNTAHGAGALRSNTTGYYNTAVGYVALSNNTTGFYNTATGDSSLASNTIGDRNTAFGTFTLAYNLTGRLNTAFGFNALGNNTTGTENTSIGGANMVRNSTGSGNTAIGRGSLFASNGSFNTATGMGTLRSNTTGNENSTHGYFSLRENISGGQNTAQGAYALFSNTTGSHNTAVGDSALYSNTTSSRITAYGSGALSSNTAGFNNTATGFGALHFNTEGNNNTAMGDSALYANTTGKQNTAQGAGALKANTTGVNNTASGYQALFSNTSGSFNTGSGYYAAHAATTASGNTTTGAYALRSITCGSGNTANGVFALSSNTTGWFNTAVGLGAGFAFKPSLSTFIGTASVATSDVTNSTALGFGATVTASNQVRIGNTAVTSIGGQVNWTSFSDGRYKMNIKENVPGIAFINKLRPVTYNLETNSIDSKLKAGQGIEGEAAKMLEGVEQPSEAKEDKNANSDVLFTGFVAQEVEKAAKELNYQFSGVDVPKNKDGFYGLRYGDFVVPLVKAVQELSRKEEENSNLKEEVELLKKELAEIRAMLKGTGSSSTTLSLSSAYLQNPAPNPSNGNTLIEYYVPSNVGSAYIVFTDIKGSSVKTINVSKGKGQLRISNNTLSAGVYNYTLFVDKSKVDTRQMIVSK